MRLLIFFGALALMISPVFGDETPAGGRSESGLINPQRRQLVPRPHVLVIEGEALASAEKPAPESEPRREQHRLAVENNGEGGSARPHRLVVESSAAETPHRVEVESPATRHSVQVESRDGDARSQPHGVMVEQRDAGEGRPHLLVTDRGEGRAHRLTIELPSGQRQRRPDVEHREVDHTPSPQANQEYALVRNGDTTPCRNHGRVRIPMRTRAVQSPAGTMYVPVNMR